MGATSLVPPPRLSRIAPLPPLSLTYAFLPFSFLQLRARKGRLVVMCSEGDDEMLSQYSDTCRIISVPTTVDCLQGIINIVPLQLFSYHLTVLRGYDVDQPRNLAKSVTTE